MRLTSLWVVGFVCVLGATALTQTPFPYLRGQNVVPVYEGWQRNSDGSFTMMFGYMNRNYEENLSIPVGPENNVEPGGPDRGQPTFFYPRRQQFLYRVRVPKDWGTKDLTWTLVSKGKTEKAYGSLSAHWEVDEELMIKNLGRASSNLDAATRDQPPTVSVRDVPPLSMKDAASLTAVVADDGVPAPVQGRGDRGGGRGEGARFENVPIPTEPTPPKALWLLWRQYRGPGIVTFDPNGYQMLPSRGGTNVTKARFSAPGKYVLRALASDSLLDAFQDVTVTVSQDQ